MDAEERRAEQKDRRAEEEATRRQEDMEQRAKERRANQEQQLWMETIRGLIPARMAPPPAAAAPQLTMQEFNENSDDIVAYLDTFEAIAADRSCPPAYWTLYLRDSLSGAGLLAISSLPAHQQDDYLAVKATLLATYEVSAESR